MPEVTGYPEFPTIAEIGKERIRRVIAKMKRDDESKLDLSTRETPDDLGFRVFKMALSTFKQWKEIEIHEADKYINQLELFTNLLKEGGKNEDVFWEVAIKEGYGLNTMMQKLDGIDENTVWKMTDPDKEQSMLICLDDELKPSTLAALPLNRDHVFVCLNKALNDTIAANLALQCRLKKI